MKSICVRDRVAWLRGCEQLFVLSAAALLAERWPAAMHTR